MARFAGLPDVGPPWQIDRDEAPLGQDRSKGDKSQALAQCIDVA